ncbi:uncharacterized protein DEA37_0009392, partial [Paragonimus westermani]
MLDLRSGYWQVAVKRTDRGKTAFTVGEKRYQFKRMPFGLSTAPFTFPHLMVQLVKRLDNVTVYGDDIVMYNNTDSEHAAHLDAFLNRIENSRLRINADNSQLGRSSVLSLGHKEEVAEAEKIQQKHEATLVSSEHVVDKRTSKAASLLAARVNRMIGEMDTMIIKVDEERKRLLRDIE